MASITLVLARTPDPVPTLVAERCWSILVRLGRRCWPLLPLGLLVVSVAWGAGFKVLQAASRLEQGVYRLDADIVYRLGKKPLQALQNGVPLTIMVEIEVLQGRQWLWDETVAQLQQFYTLEYHALSRQFLVTNVNSGERKSFPDLATATQYLGHIQGFPLLDASLLEPGGRYYVRLRVGLDRDALPVPLQLVAYLSDDWSLASEWYTCPL